MTTYIFHRGDTWYPIELRDNADAIKNAEINTGTTKVTNAVTKEVVWDILSVSGKRVYNKKHILHPDDMVIPVSEWPEAMTQGFASDNGSGYWMKDGFKSMDEVFGTPPEDATHVIWFNK